jgi:hypothetical protein
MSQRSAATAPPATSAIVAAPANARLIDLVIRAFLLMGRPQAACYGLGT